jgi:hypothetical protein
MAKKRSLRMARSSRQGDVTKTDQARPVAPMGQRPFSAKDIREILSNPTYGYGIVLEPTEVAGAAVMQLNRHLADEQRRRGEPFSLGELDQRFQALFAKLVEDGICRRGPGAQPFIPKEEWLQAQQVAVDRLAHGESL